MKKRMKVRKNYAKINDSRRKYSNKVYENIYYFQKFAKQIYNKNKHTYIYIFCQPDD